MLMLRHTPAAAYRRIAVDARVRAAGQAELVGMCYEQLTAELGAAIRAQESGDAARRAGALTRAHAALMALEMGLDRSAPIAAALSQLYGAARETILASVTAFDAAALAAVRADFREIGAALAEAA